MLQCRVFIRQGTIERILSVACDTHILDAMRHAGIHGLHAPCGGAMSCGKCLVKAEGELSAPSEKEFAVIGKETLARGYRLGCSARILGDVTIVLPEEASANILDKTSDIIRSINPFVITRSIELSEGTVDEPLDYMSSVFRAAPELRREFSAVVLKDAGIRSSLTTHRETLIISGDRLLGFASGERSYGIAVDIGTTTIVCHIADLKCGNILGTVSSLNDQRSFGADVISRIDHANKGNADSLTKTLRSQIDGMIQDLCVKVSVRPDDIHSAVCAGNSVMLHFLSGASVKRMAVSPFLSTFLQGMEIENERLFPSIHPRGLTYLMPSIATFVGGDITAGILSSGMCRRDGISLFIDFGTNGEIAICKDNEIFTCATAAGPAFEGANISCGVGGVSGAVFSVTLHNNELKIDTIDDDEPIGVCGSGIIDLAAVLLETGFADETGAFTGIVPSVVHGLEMRPEEDRIVLPGGLYFTQKDMREVQLAKAAVRAGIETLMGHFSVNSAEIDRVFVAGGFGSFIDIESAMRIGLLRREWADRIEFLGNASGEGALLALLDQNYRKAAADIAENASYLELSGSSLFNKLFAEYMLFPGKLKK